MIFYEQQPSEYRIGKGCGLSFPSHLHNQMELLLCLEGKAEITCDFQSYTLTQNDWLIVLPEREHSYLSADDFHHIMAIFKPTLVSNISKYFSQQLLTPVVHNASPLLHDCMHHLTALQTLPGHETVIKGCLYVILGSLFEQCEFAKLPSHTSNQMISQVLDFISKNYTKELSLLSVAKYVGLNQYYVSHLFRDKLHCSFYDYLHERRIDYAKYLLNNAENSITDICYACGFSTQRTFNRVFRQLVGCTPSQYKKIPPRP